MSSKGIYEQLKEGNRVAYDKNNLSLKTLTDAIGQFFDGKKPSRTRRKMKKHGRNKTTS